MIGIRLGELRNVSGYFALVNVFVLFINVLDDFLDVRKSGHVSPRFRKGFRRSASGTRLAARRVAP
jgi:hypothetical protein